MFIPSTCSVPNRLLLREPIETLEYMLQSNFDKFDFTGFSLNDLEIRYYKINNISTTILPAGNTICTLPWISMESTHPNLILNSSYIGLRYSFTSRARFELEKFTKHIPNLSKLLSIIPKWKLNFELGWIDGPKYFELLNINNTYLDYNQFIYHKEYLSDIISTISNWEVESRLLVAQEDTINEQIDILKQNIYKCKHYGIDIENI